MGLTNIDVTKSILDSVSMPVSYTHLDVYKRQDYDRAALRRRSLTDSQTAETRKYTAPTAA